MALSTDRTWKRYGDQNPYYGVLTDPRYLADRLTDDARINFLATGDEHVAHVLGVIARKVSSDFSPGRVLDFGCGVGRLTIPFASSSIEAVGVDVSPTMLVEARDNATRLKVGNVRFVESDDHLTNVLGLFDLVHTYIVLQHIPVSRGMQLVAELIDRIEPGGVGAFHLTYESQQSLSARAFRRARLVFPPLHWVVNLLRGRPVRTPMMQMNRYDLGEVVRLISERANATDLHVELTNQSGFLGAFIYFRRPTTAEGL